MTKRFKTPGKVNLEEPRLEKKARRAPTHTVMQIPKSRVEEIIIYGFLILLLMAGTYWRNRVWNSELALCIDCVKKSPNKDRPHGNLARVLSEQGKYKEAMHEYVEALRISPNSAQYHYNLGMVLSKQGKYPEAIHEYKEALRINPNFAQVHNGLGNVYLMAGDRKLALREYEILKIMNPGLANTLHQKIK